MRLVVAVNVVIVVKSETEDGSAREIAAGGQDMQAIFAVLLPLLVVEVCGGGGTVGGEFAGKLTSSRDRRTGIEKRRRKQEKRRERARRGEAGEDKIYCTETDGVSDRGED